MSIKEKGKGFIGEFKEFVTRGNALDLAVGVIIGGAFQAIVNSLVNDLISPILGIFTKGINFSDKFLVLGITEEHFATAEAAKAAGFNVFNYGSLVTSLINFLIMSFVIFLIVKGINKLSSIGKKNGEAQPEEPARKVCPFCKSEISVDAVRCPHCTSDLTEESEEK